MPKPIHLWAFLQGIGHYPSGWRHEDADPRGVFTMDYYRKVAQTAERGCFDAIVFGDQLQSRGAGGRTPERLAMPTLDPMSLLSAMASVTQHVGLVATVSTTYNTPEMLAERFGALDRISGGRAGWNIVTTAHPDTAPNFGEKELPEKSLRYRLAAQTVAEASERWTALNAKHGPSPQLRPVYVQAGQSNDGRDFAARTAEAIFCPAATIEDGIAFRSDLRRRIAEAGRDPDGVKIMPGLSFMLADTPEEAIARDEALLALADEALCIEYLSDRWASTSRAIPPMGRSPPRPSSPERSCPPPTSPARWKSRWRRGDSGAFASRFVRTPRGHNIFRGTPEQMAEMMIAWVEAGACDGFTLQPAFMASELEMFVERVVPLLQARGALRKAYPGTTLRETMGLTRLPSEMAA
jgi:alkanesulfonate monooxygenase SsuD/methylene tetrahydromethanopterin reductase-like flavin-dependent oxidoreductase (luciferase family)